jgi:hypothetical protein
MDEIGDEAAHDGHILRAVAGPIAGQVIAELDVEQPMHASDAPMTPRGPGGEVDIDGAEQMK